VILEDPNEDVEGSEVERENNNLGKKVNNGVSEDL
jgi:hypothetical protein